MPFLKGRAEKVSEPMILDKLILLNFGLLRRE